MSSDHDTNRPKGSDQFIDEYSALPTSRLNSIKRSLVGNVHNHESVARRIQAIDWLLSLRRGRGLMPKQDNDETGSDELQLPGRHADLDVAERYINKYRNAVSRGIGFNLSLSDMRKLLNKKLCFYTGIRMNNIANDPHQLTIERLDSNKPYTRDNTVACCLAANKLKGEYIDNSTSPFKLTVKQFKRMAAVMQQGK